MPREKKPTLKKRKDGRYKCVYHGIQFYGATPEEAFAARDEYKLNEKRGFQRQTVSEYALPWLKRAYPSVRKIFPANLKDLLADILRVRFSLDIF